MTVLVRYVRDYRRSVSWWSVGLLGLVAFTVAFYPTVEGQPGFDELLERLPPAVRAFVGTKEGISITSAPGYLQARLFGSLLPVLLLVFGVGVGARAIGGSEDDGTLELLLSNPVTRLRVALERYGSLLLLLALLLIVTTLALVAMSPPFGALEGVSITHLLGAIVAAGCLGLFHASVAFAVGCASGRRGTAVAAATTLAVAGFLVQGIFEAAAIEGWVRNLSPWEWYLAANAIVDGPTLSSVLLPVALSALVVAAGVVAFARRDLH
jgi:ABC-2 type transport system permease protein